MVLALPVGSPYSPRRGREGVSAVSVSDEAMAKRAKGAFGTLRRRFVVFYFGFALVPLALLFFVFCRYGDGDYSISLSRENLGVLVLLVGAAMSISVEDIQTLRDAARLHDIGKIGISDSILLKPDSLSSEEMDMMKKHPIIGQRIVTPLRSFVRAAEPIRHHHERLDGSGYPDGLQGDEIPAITRIIMVADTYDAMTTDQPYRKSRPWADAREEFETLVGNGQMDASVVATLFTLVESGQLA